MDFFKDFFLITLEMCFAIFIIIFGYAIWDSFDLTEYNIAKNYDNTSEIEVYIDDTKNYISSSDGESNIDYTKLYLHNISDKNNDKELLFKVGKDNEYLKNNAILNINNNYFELNKLKYVEDNYFRYYIIENINFNGYETKEFNVKILLKDNFDEENLNYEFTTII